MGTARHQYTDEFKREAVGLLASSGRPLSQIAGELGISAARLRAWRNRSGGKPGGIDAAPQHAGFDPACWRGFGRRECPVAARKRAPAHGAGDFKKNAAHLLGSTEMKFRLIGDQRETFPVRVLCDVMGVSPAGYYAWRGRPESLRKTANRALLGEIRRVHLAHRGRYGGPRIHMALRSEGHTASRGRIERLMRHHGIRAITARRFRVCTTDSHHDLPIAPNRLAQNFAAERPNQVWLADISYVPTAEGWLYLAVVLDLFTRKIVGWAMRDHIRAELAIAALATAIQRQKPPPGLIHHSDRGSQYAAGDYRKVLDAAGMIQSMSRKGNCWDNAPMESCFGTIKTELVHQVCYKTRDEARHDLFAYIEGYYNRQRLHSALGYITPEQAERQAA